MKRQQQNTIDNKGFEDQYNKLVNQYQKSIGSKDFRYASNNVKDSFSVSPEIR